MIVFIHGVPETAAIPMATEVAHSLGARLATLDDAGHFWPYQVPKAGAALLEEFWAGL